MTGACSHTYNILDGMPAAHRNVATAKASRDKEHAFPTEKRTISTTPPNTTADTTVDGMERAWDTEDLAYLNILDKADLSYAPPSTSSTSTLPSEIRDQR
jgi:hypothetical protein